MTAVSELLAKATAEYPSYPLDFEDGNVVQFKSVMLLDKAQLKTFSEAQKNLAAQDQAEDGDVDSVREGLISTLAGVADDEAKAREGLDKLPLGALAIVFKEYGENQASEDATKSENAA